LDGLHRRLEAAYRVSRLLRLSLVVLGAGIAASLAAVLFLARMVGREAYYWSTLYLGSGLIAAFATLVTIPFAIWVLVIQSRFGSLLARLFLTRAINLFIFLLLSVLVTSVAMVASFTRQYYTACYALLIVEAGFFIPVIGGYVFRLMSLQPREVVKIVLSVAETPIERIAALLRLAGVYLRSEDIEEEQAGMQALRILLGTLQREGFMKNVKPEPRAWHEFRSFLLMISRRDVHLPMLPSRRLLGELMQRFMEWVLLHGRDRAAATLIRSYRRVVLRYIEARLPSEVVLDLFLVPVLEPLRKLQAPYELLVYAYEQVELLVMNLYRLARRGEVTRREACITLMLIRRFVSRMGPEELAGSIVRLSARLSRSLGCQGRRRAAAQQAREAAAPQPSSPAAAPEPGTGTSEA